MSTLWPHPAWACLWCSSQIKRLQRYFTISPNCAIAGAYSAEMRRHYRVKSALYLLLIRNFRVSVISGFQTTGGGGSPGAGASIKTGAGGGGASGGGGGASGAGGGGAS